MKLNILILLPVWTHITRVSAHFTEYLDAKDSKSSRINPKFVNKWLDEYFEVSGNRVPPRMLIEWMKLASMNNCSARPSDYKQIFEDLKPFKLPGMSDGYMKVAAEIIEGYGREILSLTPQQMMEISKRLPLHVGNSLDLIRTVLNPDIDFSILLQYSDESMIIPSDDHSYEPYKSMEDVFERNSRMSAVHGEYWLNNSLLRVPASFNSIPIKLPVMSVSRIVGYSDIIMPTRRTGLGVLTKEQRDLANLHSDWNQKGFRAIFRGTSLGINFGEAKKRGLDVTVNLRFKLQEMAQNQRDGLLNCSVPLDFAITKYLQLNGDFEHLNELRERYPERTGSGWNEMFQSKFVVLVDGNGWPDKVAGIMYSGSLVFLATVHEDWVIRQLIDGVHYIRVKPDLSDLLEKLEWAAAHEDEAQRIAENGRMMAAKRFDTNCLQVYNAFLMMEYQNLFK